MTKKNNLIVLFHKKQVRRQWDEENDYLTNNQMKPLQNVTV